MSEPKVIQGVDPTLNVPNAISEQAAKDAQFELATDINELATRIVFWHNNVCNQAQHVLNLDLNNPDDPQEVLIKAYDRDHAEADEHGFRALTHAEMVPFKHGVRYVLDMMEQLPFSYTPSDADGNTLPEYSGRGFASEETKQD